MNNASIHPILTAHTEMREAPDYEIKPIGGLTKREWYAGLAMRAMIAAGSYGGADKVAHDAFEQADAMIGEAEA